MRKRTEFGMFLGDADDLMDLLGFKYDPCERSSEVQG